MAIRAHDQLLRLASREQLPPSRIARDLEPQRATFMSTSHTNPTDPVMENLDRLLPDLEVLYKDVHAHPELSMQEVRTAGLAADRLRAAGYEVTTGVGKTGVVGVLRNGEGTTGMTRAAR